jgi:hypothetical protein
MKTGILTLMLLSHFEIWLISAYAAVEVLPIVHAIRLAGRRRHRLRAAVIKFEHHRRARGR